MTDATRTPHRELGVEFGELADRMEEHSYPTTNEELVDAFGEHTIDLPNGSETVDDILGSFSNETYDSVGEARQAVFTMVDSRAIGRKNYSDRTPPAPGERREDQQLSF